MKIVTGCLLDYNFIKKNKTGTTLSITEKKLRDGELPHELFLATRQKTKIRNVFVNTMLTDEKLSKAQISRMNRLVDLLVLG